MDIPHRVHPALHGLVDRMQGYAYQLDPRAVHHGTSGPAGTVIISFVEPLDLAWLDDPNSRTRHWLLASGLHTGPVLIRTHGIQIGIQLDLTPAGSRALLGLPIGAIAHGIIDHADLPLGIPEVLHARMNEVGWPERFRLLEDHLLRVASRAEVRLPTDLAQAWRVLDDKHGQVRVAELAETIGWSRRHLVNRFTQEFGLPPRDIARLHRFGSAQKLARRGVPWGDVAARAGYADQPHLSREFRTFAGQTPSQWLADMFPIALTRDP